MYLLQMYKSRGLTPFAVQKVQDTQFCCPDLIQIRVQALDCTPLHTHIAYHQIQCCVFPVMKGQTEGK